MSVKSVEEFHRSLRSRGKGAKDWSNSWTEHEYLGVDEKGRHKFGVNISVGHRVFKDKSDDQWKKRKLTDNRPDHAVIQGAQCCVEVYPYYAKYFDVQHEEVRLHEERWVVQRLFKEPDTWRDVSAYNPVMVVEEYADAIKVIITYDTDYGSFVLEYFQRDALPLKHNITFTNNSGGEDIFRVLQRWSGIRGTKVNGRNIATKSIIKGSLFTFRDDDNKFKIGENASGLMWEGLKDVLEVFTGSREPVIDELVLVDSNGIKLTVKNHQVHLWIDGKEVMTSNPGEISAMVRAVEDCPDNARVFIGGLGLGVILLALALSRKAVEVIVCEIDQRVINATAQPIQDYFGSRLNLQIIQGDAAVEVSRHGKFDWVFMDFFYEDELNEANEEWLKNVSSPNLTEDGIYTSYSQPELHNEGRVPYLKPTEFDIHPQGLKVDFVYGCWILGQGERLIIDPATYTNNNPTVDGNIEYTGGTAYDRYTALANLVIGNEAARGAWGGDWRPYVEWDITALPDDLSATSTIFKYDGDVNHIDNLVSVYQMSSQPSVQIDNDAGNQVIFDDCGDGNLYVNASATFPVVGNTQQIDLGALANADLEGQLGVNWFAIGMKGSHEGETTQYFDEIVSEDGVSPTPAPTLYVEYTEPGGGGGAGAVVGGSDYLTKILLQEGIID